MTGVYLHLGAAPERMRVRELGQPAAVVEVLSLDDPQRLADAVRAETRPCPGPPAGDGRPHPEAGR